MSTALPGTVRIGPVSAVASQGDLLELWTHACGRCGRCTTGAPEACRTPASRPRVPARWAPLGEHPVPAAAAAATLARTLAAVDMVRQVAGPPTVAVVGDDPDGVVMTALTGQAALVLAGAGRRAWPGSGRCDVVVSLDGDLRTAAKLVRRGGAVAPVGGCAIPPAMATVVQRELRFLACRDPEAAAASPALRSVGGWRRVDGNDEEGTG